MKPGKLLAHLGNCDGGYSNSDLRLRLVFCERCSKHGSSPVCADLHAGYGFDSMIKKRRLHYALYTDVDINAQLVSEQMTPCSCSNVQKFDLLNSTRPRAQNCGRSFGLHCQNTGSAGGNPCQCMRHIRHCCSTLHLLKMLRFKMHLRFSSPQLSTVFPLSGRPFAYRLHRCNFLLSLNWKMQSEACKLAELLSVCCPRSF